MQNLDNSVEWKKSVGKKGSKGGRRRRRKMAGSDKKLKAEAAHIEIIIQSDWCN